MLTADVEQEEEEDGGQQDNVAFSKIVVASSDGVSGLRSCELECHYRERL